MGNTVYVATQDGLSISTDGGETFTNKTTANGLGHDITLGVEVVGTTIYVATHDGLSISTDNGNTFTNKTTVNGLGSNIVNDVYVLGSNIFAATNGGLSVSSDDGESFFYTFTTADGLGSNSVSSVFLVSSTIFVGTSNGLGIYTTATLPVQLISFSASPQANNFVQLKWETASETNNDHFLIQRSTDLKHVETIHRQTPSESAGERKYTHTDKQPYAGTSYYRLVQVDRDGSQTPYRWVSVVVGQPDYGVFPNPVSDGRFTLRLDEPEKANLHLYNSNGQQVNFNRSNLGQGKVGLHVTGSIATGVYFLEVAERAQVRVHRVMFE